jgi:hypothetical protein
MAWECRKRPGRPATEGRASERGGMERIAGCGAACLTIAVKVPGRSMLSGVATLSEKCEVEPLRLEPFEHRRKPLPAYHPHTAPGRSFIDHFQFCLSQVGHDIESGASATHALFGRDRRRLLRWTAFPSSGNGLGCTRRMSPLLLRLSCGARRTTWCWRRRLHRKARGRHRERRVIETGFWRCRAQLRRVHVRRVHVRRVHVRRVHVRRVHGNRGRLRRLADRCWHV